MATHSSILAWTIHPMDRGAWWAPVPGVTKSQTRLSDCHFHCPFLEAPQPCPCSMWSVYLPSWAASVEHTQLGISAWFLIQSKMEDKPERSLWGEISLASLTHSFLIREVGVITVLRVKDCLEE